MPYITSHSMTPTWCADIEPADALFKEDTDVLYHVWERTGRFVDHGLYLPKYPVREYRGIVSADVLAKILFQDEA